MGFFDGLTNSVSDIFGGASNNAGTVAQAAPLIQPVTLPQVNAATGLGNSGVINSFDLATALNPGANQGIQTQSNLATALQNQANGVGPNPAQSALSQSTGQNIASQGSLEAGQRGASANVGLEGRQIAQQGAGIQQNAIGQAATLQAQQQLAAQNQLQTLAGTQVNQAQTGVNAENSAAQTNQGNLLGALQGYNTNQVSNVGTQNSANAGIAETNANNTGKAVGGLFQGAAAAPLLFASQGGETSQLLAKALSKRAMPDHMRSMAEIYHPKVLKMADGGPIDQPIQNDSSVNFNPLSEVEQLAPLVAAVAANKGAVVPGNPKVPGKNTQKNDVVPAMLTPKEIVLPLSVTQAKNPGEAAKAFVENIKGKSKDSDFKQALKDHVKNRKSKR